MWNFLREDESSSIRLMHNSNLIIFCSDIFICLMNEKLQGFFEIKLQLSIQNIHNSKE